MYNDNIICNMHNDSNVWLQIYTKLEVIVRRLCNWKLFVTFSRQPTLTCIVLETITTKFF